MLLIPAENGISRANPPCLTILLIILNVLAFNWLQGGDAELYEQAYDVYLEEELLPLEKQAFEDYAYQTQGELYDAIVGNDFLGDENLVSLIMFDLSFAKHITNLTNYSVEWRKKREKFNQIMAQTSRNQYAYQTAEPTLFTAFSSMFMHGDIFHLLGNMLFLFLFGFNLELLVGRAKMLGVYLLSGLAAVAMFGATTEAYTTLVGASGAIAGLMGGFVAFYGFKKIRYFYWVFLFFGYIRLPAFMVLVYYLAKEYLQADANDGVAYMAHFGGLLAGAVLVWLLKLIPQKQIVAEDFAETKVRYSSSKVAGSVGKSSLNSQQQPQAISSAMPSVSHQERIATYEKGVNAVQQLDFELAKSCFYQLLEQEPSHPEYLNRLYSLEKNNVKSKAYGDLCQKILQASNTNQQLQQLAEQVVIDLKHHTGGFHSIEAQTLVSYSKRMLKLKKPLAIKPIINFLAQEYRQDPNLPDLMLHFAIALNPDDDYETRRKVLKFISAQYAESFAGKEAATILAQES